MDKLDGLVSGGEGGLGDVDDRPSFQQRRDDAHCCPYPGQAEGSRKGLLGRWRGREGASGGLAGQGWWWFRRHRPHRLPHRCCSHDGAQSDEDCSRARDDAGRLRSGPGGGGSYQRLERSPA